MDESVYASQVEPGEITLDTYETLYGSLYAYRSGIIGFLELLDRFEKMLHIKLPQPAIRKLPMPRNSIEAAFLYQAELMNRDSRLRSGMAVMLFLVVH